MASFIQTRHNSTQTLHASLLPVQVLIPHVRPRAGNLAVATGGVSYLIYIVNTKCYPFHPEFRQLM